MDDGLVIFEAIRATKPPPCEYYRCLYYSRCAEKLLACKAFQFYVTLGRVVNPYSENNIGPNKGIYNKLYNSKENENE